MNRAILSLVLIQSVLGQVRAPEDSAQRAMREFREQSAAQQRQLEIWQLQQQQEDLADALRKMQKAQKEAPLPRSAPTRPNDPTNPLLPPQTIEAPARLVDAATFAKLEKASFDRVFARYPSLRNKEAPWRKRLDRYISAQRIDPKRADLFNRSDWPERIVLEFGAVNGIADPLGNPIRR